MTKLARGLQRALQAGKPPRPQATIDAETLSWPNPAVVISIGGSLDEVLQRLSIGVTGPILVIPDQRDDGTPTAVDVESVATWMLQDHDLVVGYPAGSSDDVIGRLPAVRLGRSGWNRVTFGQQSLILENADLPSELFSDRHVILLSHPSGSGCLAAWVELAHPNTGLRARFSGNATIELAMAVPATYLLLGEVDGRSLAIYATTPIAAELAARALERLSQRRRGIETSGPWEDPGIQHLSELGQATPAVTRLVARLSVEDNRDERTGRDLAELLGWGVQMTSSEAEGDHR